MYVPNSTESQYARDPDLLEQARPGHGVPSQDPDPAGQFALSNLEARIENKTVYMGAGVLIGAATGAALGAMIAGPVGIVVGGTTGAVAGGLGGAAVRSL